MVNATLFIWSVILIPFALSILVREDDDEEGVDDYE
jgi:hypothetical protein